MNGRVFKTGEDIYCNGGRFRTLRRELTDRGYVIACGRLRRGGNGGYHIHIIQAPERAAAVEDKEKIVELLLPVLQQTRAGCDITELRYEDGGLKGTETVYCKIEHGSRVDELFIDVSADSGIAMIKDIIKRID